MRVFFLALLAGLAAASAIERRSNALAVVDNVMPLKSVVGMLPKTRMLLARGSQSAGANGHDIPLANVDKGQVFIAPVQVGTDTYEVVIDTGSSNPWLVQKNYTCYNPYNPKAKHYNCRFGKGYTPDAMLQRIPNRNFNISYDDGSALIGTMGYEKFVMAGFEVGKQEFGLVDRAGWNGDGTSSGLVGFSYRFLTMSFKGTDPDEDQADQVIRYNPLFTNMIANGVQPVFSLVVNQSNTGTGVMALGGIPNGYESLKYISTPIHQTVINNKTNRAVHEFYAVNPTHIVFSNKTDGTLIKVNTSISEPSQKKPVYAHPSDYIVDSGTTLMYIHNDTMVEFAKQFDPPATFKKGQDGYVVPCNATAPKFGIAFGDDVIEIAKSDLIPPIVDGGICYLGVQSNISANYNILGGTFLKNVVAVFDVGHSMMHFAQRQTGH